jgi:hypothetical protein
VNSNTADAASLEAALRRVLWQHTECRKLPRISIVPAPVLRFPVISHDEVLRILADKPTTKDQS